MQVGQPRRHVKPNALTGRKEHRFLQGRPWEGCWGAKPQPLGEMDPSTSQPQGQPLAKVAQPRGHARLACLSKIMAENIQ